MMYNVAEINGTNRTTSAPNSALEPSAAHDTGFMVGAVVGAAVGAASLVLAVSDDADDQT